MNFLGIVAVGGYVVLRTAEAGVRIAVKSKKGQAKSENDTEESVFLVHSDGVSNEGVQFLSGDKLRILDIMEDAVLIERIGDKGNPYVISADLLHSISDY